MYKHLKKESNTSMKEAARISDHGLGEIPFAAYDESELEQIFQAGRKWRTCKSRR